MDDEIVQPLSSFTVVELERKPILWLPDGTPLVRRPVGFDTSHTNRRERGDTR